MMQLGASMPQQEEVSSVVAALLGGARCRGAADPATILRILRARSGEWPRAWEHVG